MLETFKTDATYDISACTLKQCRVLLSKTVAFYRWYAYT